MYATSLHKTLDVTSFYDKLLLDVYSYQDEGLVFICGDFNSRTGDLDDFISGIDDVPTRNVIDFSTNAYGELFIDFLLNTNMCMLNGRNCIKNDYTSVSTKGASVVDYCVIRHEHLEMFSDFSVNLTCDVISKYDNIV